MSKAKTPMKKTKIVATLGPASAAPETIRRLVEAGVNVFRLNLSHVRSADLPNLVRDIRDVGRRLSVPVGILADLRGPRVRIGEVEGGSVALVRGARIVLTPEPVVGTAERLSVTFPGLARDLAVGARVLVDDGNIELEVVDLAASGEIVGKVLRGGSVANHRGINVPKRSLSLPALTDKDLADVASVIELGVDFIALSFVQNAADVRQLKDRIAACGGYQRVVAKIERENAVRDIEAIAAEAHAVMIARGDLALEMGIEETPIAQKHIMSVCRSLDRPVITATQMLESMTSASKPTRAEAADVANAVLDGTDALMLSGETSIGVDPVNVVETMTRIALRVERAIGEGCLRPPPEVTSPPTTVEALASASKAIAEQLRTALIVVYTRNGNAAIRLASLRPWIPILALCPDETMRRRLSLVWGVESREIDVEEASLHLLNVATREAVASGLARPGDRTVISAGSMFAEQGVTDFLKIDCIP